MPLFVLLSKAKDLALGRAAESAEIFLLDVKPARDAELYEIQGGNWREWETERTYDEGRAWIARSAAIRHSIPPRRVRLRRG